jgi:ATP-dependent Clp protease ATP-binding subunit ClpA
LLAEQGITRLDILNYISHGITRTPPATVGAAASADQMTDGEAPAYRAPADALLTYVSLTDRARGAARPSDAPTRAPADDQVLCRRRKNNPVFVGDPGVGKNGDGRRPGRALASATMCRG